MSDPARLCLTCGKAHVEREIPDSAGRGMTKNMVTWEDPDDGHSYRPESWEAVALRLWTKLKKVRA